MEIRVFVPIDESDQRIVVLSAYTYTVVEISQGANAVTTEINGDTRNILLRNFTAKPWRELK